MEVMFSWRRSYGFVLASTLLAVATADFFFYGHVVGWTAAGFVALMLMLLVGRDARFLRTWGGRVVLLAAVGLVYSLVEQPTWLNVPQALVCLGMIAIVNAFGWQRDLVDWVARWARLLMSGWVRVFADNGVVVRWLVRHGFSPRAARGVTAWGLPLLLGMVFIGLFAWANPVIARWLGELRDWTQRLVEMLPDLLNPARAALWLGAAVFCWTLLRFRGRRRGAAVDEDADAAVDVDALAAVFRIYQRRRAMDLLTGFVIRCLIVFNVIFLVQNALDARFLLDPASMPAGLAYTEYVHRGAYPLIAAALLAGGFVILMFRPDSATERSRWARGLVYAWIGQTIFLTLSAAWRLEQYVELALLSRWRIASAIWFGLVAAGLVFTIVRIVGRRSDRWLVNVNALTAALVLYACCFVNFDRIIGEYNARHCRQVLGRGAALDIEYFGDLGPGALPALEWIRPKLTQPAEVEAAGRVANRLRAQLDDELSDWRGWTLRRARAAEAVGNTGVVLNGVARAEELTSQ